MKSKMLSNANGRREWALIFDAGDEVSAGLKQFAAEQKVGAAHFTGIGAFAALTVAWFDLEKKAYQPIEINEQVEVLSLMGDVAESKGEPSVHAHICVGTRDGSARGGHLQKGKVRPTLEVTLVESAAHLRKTYRPEFGIALIDLDRSSATATVSRQT